MLAIHMCEGSFSDKWIEYCDENEIKYKLVNCYSSNIVEDLKDCRALLWHWHHNDLKAQLFARQLTFSLEQKGMVVFPSSKNSWHFDDKIGQKYLLEGVGAPIVKSHIFYNKEDALQWSNETSYPKVFKLRGGAGAINVKLARSKSEANRYINKAFTGGFKHNRFTALKERLWHFKRDKSLDSFINITRGIGRAIFPRNDMKNLPTERGYAYFQDFIKDNDSDIRIIVIGDQAFAIKRMVRDGDFRASGSGKIIYDPQHIPLECVRLSFKFARKLELDCVAYDYVINEGKPEIVEISYGFASHAYLGCTGLWDADLNWTKCEVNPEALMVERVLEKLSKNHENLNS